MPIILHRSRPRIADFRLHSIVLRFGALGSPDGRAGVVHMGRHSVGVRWPRGFRIGILWSRCSSRTWRRDAIERGGGPTDGRHVWAARDTIWSGIAVSGRFEGLRGPVAARMGGG